MVIQALSTQRLFKNIIFQTFDDFTAISIQRINTDMDQLAILAISNSYSTIIRVMDINALKAILYIQFNHYFKYCDRKTTKPIDTYTDYH